MRFVKLYLGQGLFEILVATQAIRSHRAVRRPLLFP